MLRILNGNVSASVGDAICSQAEGRIHTLAMKQNERCTASIKYKGRRIVTFASGMICLIGICSSAVAEPLTEAASKLGETEIERIQVGGTLVDQNEFPKDFEKFSGNDIPSPVVELFSIIAKIAVDKAKRQGLRALQDKIRKAVCGISLKDTKRPAFSHTCDLLKASSLQALIAQPKTTTSVVIRDSIDIIARRFVENTLQLEELRPYALLTIDVASDALSRAPPRFSEQDATALVSSLLNELARDPVIKKKPQVQLAVATLRKCVKENRTECSVSNLLEAKEKTTTSTVMAAERLVLLGTQALTSKDAPDRVRSAIQLTIEVVAHYTSGSEKEGLESIQQILDGAIEQDVAKIVSSSAALLGTIIEAQSPGTFRKGVALLTAVAGYSATYVDTGNEKAAAELQAAQREQRTQIIENLIESVTDRSDRHGEWVVSLGVNVGFDVTGVQFNQEDSDGDFEANYQTPILTLPTGIAVQYLPGKTLEDGSGGWTGTGAHLMISLLDLGQFVAYDTDGNIARPRWNTVLSPGFQAGWAFGDASNTFVLGGDFRYVPALFADTNEASPETGGVIRLGVFLGYYVSLFDLN